MSAFRAAASLLCLGHLAFLKGVNIPLTGKYLPLTLQIMQLRAKLFKFSKYSGYDIENGDRVSQCETSSKTK